MSVSRIALAHLALCIASATLLLTSRAAAWLELRVASDVATVEVASNGSLKVRHELSLKVRGGPLKRFVIQGVDDNAVPLEGATIVRAKSGRAAGIPIPLVVKRDEDLLDLELTYKKGVGTGSYLVEFAYQTEATEGRIERRDDRILLNWKSPRFDDGIDSLKARFVLPRSEPPPKLYVDDDQDDGARSSDVVATTAGVFLLDLHREADQDVLELTRPHAARGEQVAWRIQLAPDAITTTPATDTQAAPPRPRPRVTRREMARVVPWALGSAIGLLLVGLVWLKHRFLRAQRPRGNPAAFVVRLPYWMRAFVFVAAVTSAFGLALDQEQATASAICLSLAIVLALQIPVADRPEARGPGTFKEVDEESVLGTDTGFKGWGCLLEGSTLPGFFVFAIAMGVVAVFALRDIGEAPYRSASMLALSTLLVPLFFPVGKARLCQPRIVLEQRALLPLWRRLRKRGIPVQLIARVTSCPDDPNEVIDEYRVRFDVNRPRTGLDGLELAIESTHGGWFLVTQPVFIARVREGSKAHEALPRAASWSRGRFRDERIALLRPPLPTEVLCVDAALDLLKRLTEPPATAQRKRPMRSSGNGALNANAGVLAPPA